MTNKIQIGLRVKPEIKEKLESEAINQNRSINNLIEVIIQEYFDKKEKRPK